MDRNKLVKFCTDYLQVEKFPDGCVNGLQVEGTDKIEKIITGVSLSQKLLNEAIKRKAQMVIVHHGLFGKYVGSPIAIEGFMRGRLKLILANDINLCGFHLPLDAHPVIGNNASLAKLLELKKIRAFNCPNYGDIGFVGEFDRPVALDDFIKLVNKKINTNAKVIAGGPKMVNKIGIVSGGSPSDYQSALAAGADTYLTGEVKESVVEQAGESGVNYVWAGHYNTEKLGIRNLGNLIAEKFKVKVEFVDIPCEI